MPSLSTPTLLEFLHEEACQLESSPPPAGGEPLDKGNAGASLRVPLELSGSLWSAEIEGVEERRLHLIVDRDAVGQLGENEEAAIHYQPLNSPMQRTAGRVTSGDHLPRNRVRLNFELC